jgi:hypothetical protein
MAGTRIENRICANATETAAPKEENARIITCRHWPGAAAERFGVIARF